MRKNSVIKLILSARQINLYKAFQEHFQNLPDVEIFNGYFQDLSEFDCMVSAANSFGLMDGGVDLGIINFFGQELMHRVQQRILSEYLGEQPVGTSMIVETNHPQHPFIAHTPTMRIPMKIASTDNVYLAMWAMLLAVRKHNQNSEKLIKIVVCPGLGTGTGKVPYFEAARQMSLAYKNFLNPPHHITWDWAGARQGEIIYGGDMGFKLNYETNS
ncbi:macro domain-containing protein [Anabaena azotica]|uniref:macro domain-containing protein n=1 Tax=Anabaena azotica TaxID=197653 RepID=UPI0039A4049D